MARLRDEKEQKIEDQGEYEELTDLEEEMEGKDLSDLEEKECYSKSDLGNLKKFMEGKENNNCFSHDKEIQWVSDDMPWVPEIYVQIPEFPKSYLTGAAEYLEPYVKNDWHKMLPFIKSRACADDFLRFKYSVWRAYVHLLFSSIPETSDLHPSAFSERQLLKQYHLIQHIMLSGVKPDVSQTNESASDTYLLEHRHGECNIAFIPHVGQTNESDSDTSSLLNYNYLYDDIRHAFWTKFGALERVDSLHQYFAYRQGLAQCDFIKWDSDAEEVIHRLKAKTGWSELPDGVLMTGLGTHLNVLKKLKESEETGSQPSENLLLNWINREYADRLKRSRQYRSFPAMIKYCDFANLDYLSRECAVEAKAVASVSLKFLVHLPASEVVMRNKQLEWFAGMKDKAKWASESMKDLPRVTEQYGKRVGGGLVGKAYVLFASVALTMGMAGLTSKT